MAKINLLPWRAELRKEQQRQFLTIMGLSVLLVAVVLLAVHFQYSRLIGVQQGRNAYLNTRIAEVEAQITEINKLAAEKDRLLDRMGIIQRLQQNRPEIVRLFDELVRVLPEGVHLESLKQTSNNLAMEGIAQSNARVSALMRNIDESEWLSDPKLGEIKADSKTKKKESTRKFTLRAVQKAKKAKEGEKTNLTPGADPGKQANAGKNK